MCTHCIATEEIHLRSFINLMSIVLLRTFSTSESIYRTHFNENTLGKQPSIVKGCQRQLLLVSPSPSQNQEAGQPKSKKMWSLWKHLTKSLFGRNVQTWSLTPFFCPHKLLCHKQAQSQVVSQATIESSVFFSIFMIPTSVENQSANLPGAGLCQL